MRRRLAEFPVVTLAAPKYLARRRTPRTPDDLEGHVFVNFFSTRTGRVFEVDWRPPDESNAARIARVPPHVVAANDADTWIALAVAGLGIVQTPLSSGVRALVERGALRLLMPGWRSEPLPSNVLYPATRHLPARVRHWVDWLVTLYAAEGAEATRFLVEAEARAASARRPRA